MTTSCCTPTRRSLLQGAAAVAGLAAAEAVSGTRYAFAEAGSGPGDVLVVLGLRGGFDGLSAVAPVGDPAYAAARAGIRVPTARGLQLDATFALHPALAPLKPLWDAGTFGVVHAVGSPEPSRSHFEATTETERAAYGTSIRTGWVDRFLQTLGTPATWNAVAVGGSMVPLSMSGPAPEVGLRSLKDFELPVWEGIRDQYASALRSLHSGVAGPSSATALQTLTAVETARRAAALPVGAGYPETDLGRSLADVARLVRAGVGLRVATVDVGNWDMHEGLGGVDGGWMARQLGQLAAALAAFAADLGPDLDRVVLVSTSEFGRRVRENGSGGVDHGNGNAVLVLGGGVRGGAVHGRWPGLAPQQLADGDLRPTTDHRDVLAEVLRTRCGASDAALRTVFPGLRAQPPGAVRPRG